LQPITRQVWVAAGEVPTAVVNWKREWLWLYAFVQPQTGETYWWLLPYVNTHRSLIFATGSEAKRVKSLRTKGLNETSTSILARSKVVSSIYRLWDVHEP
jgi:hypothetical protein